MSISLVLFYITDSWWSFLALVSSSLCFITWFPPFPSFICAFIWPHNAPLHFPIFPRDSLLLHSDLRFSIFPSDSQRFPLPLLPIKLGRVHIKKDDTLETESFGAKTFHRFLAQSSQLDLKWNNGYTNVCFTYTAFIFIEQTEWRQT